MDPISHRLDHWVRFISRLATLSISMHQGYHNARSTLAGFISLLGTIFRAIANLSRSLSHSHSHSQGFGLGLGLGSSRLEVQDILFLLWALLRVVRHHLLRRLLRRLLGYLPVGFVGFFARVRPALVLPVWLRQLGSAPPPPPPPLPSAARHPFALPPPSAAALPSFMPSAPSFGLPGLPASTPWHLANYRQSLPPLPPYLHGQPTGYYPPASAAVSAPSASPSAPASGPPAVPAQTPGLLQLRQLRQQRQLQQSQSEPESGGRGGGGGGGGAPR